MTAQDVLRKAAAEIGYFAPDDPEPGSKYGRWLAERLGQPWLAGPSSSIWWCVIFAAWVYDNLATVPGLPGYNTDHTLGVARTDGAILSDVRQAQPGDAVVFDWDKSTAATNHFGIVEINAESHLQTIEGNTSGSDGPRQSNGNGVWRRTRSWDVVAGIIRPTYNTEVFVDTPVVSVLIPPPTPIFVPTPVRPNCVDLQRAVHTNDDNAWGSDTDKHCFALRAASNWGGRKFPFGVEFTQMVVGAKPDGAWGGKSSAAHDSTVALVQIALGSMGFDPNGVDGTWGDDSEAAYRAARRACHI